MPYADPVKNAACIKRWSQANRTKMRGYQRQWRLRNVDKARAAGRDYWRERVRVDGPVHCMLAHAKRRAKQRGVPCTISVNDIHVPTHCPVFGTPLKMNVRAVGPDSPTLDCVIPALGYVPGNVCVVSHLANRRKGNMTLADLHALAAYVEAHCRGD